VPSRHKRYLYGLLARYIAFYLPDSGRVIEVRPPSPRLRDALALRRIAVEPINESQSFGSQPERIILAGCIHFSPDIQDLLEQLRPLCAPQTRVILTYFSNLWKPIFGLASRLGLADTGPAQNWVAPSDVHNLLALAGFELVASTPRVLMPIYIPVISAFLNRWIAPLPFFRTFALAHVAIARPRAATPALDAPRPSVSVIVPARNERGNVEAAVRRLPAMGPADELIFVEGHSSDGTFEEMERVAALFPDKPIRVFRQTGRGKGDAVRLGFREARREILMILDADLTVPPEALPKFYRAIVDDVGEFVNGSRLVYPMEQRAMRFANMIGNKFFAAAFSFLLGQPLKDTLCGTKVLSRLHYEAIARDRGYFGDFDPFGDFDLLFGAARQGLKIIELPIRYHERTYGDTNIRRWAHGLVLLRMTIFAGRRMRFL
jgi:hypothetical protein